MQITFWGVRGSFPAPGPNSVKYGGNTPCVQVIDNDTHIIVDAGTGLYALGKTAPSQPTTHHLVFSHIHWDHIQGLPFFSPLYNPSSQIIIYAPDNCIDLLQNILIGASRCTFLPNPPGQASAQLHFNTYRSGESWSIGKIKIGAVELNHPCHSYGLRFDHQERSFVYYSDTAPFDDILFGSKYLPRAPRQKPSISETRKLWQMRQAAVELSSKTDLLIHDAHFTPEEYPRFAHFGHSTPQHALDMAIAARVKALVLYHHAPERKD
ncbi:MAG: MBL fold metallo-hydrolase, partial [Anaerolineales bacterium]|nr:MBL fold metallo-hydrolase [Anaerolineales bacterium]